LQERDGADPTGTSGEALDMSDELVVGLLGSFRMSSGGRRIEGVRTPRLESLVAYLLIHRDRPIARGQLASILWPESTDAQALTNLRRELHLLRRALPEPDRVIVLEKRTVGWRPDGPFRCDVFDFEAAVERGRSGDPASFEMALRLYDGPLLPTCYDDWIAPERERLHEIHLEASERLVADLEERREYRRAMQLLRRLIQLDPLRESAYQALMRIAALAGDRSAGLQAYHAAVSNFHRELGVEPDAETRAAYRRLLALDSATPGDHSSAAAEPTVGSRRLVGSASQPFVGRRGEWAAVLEAWKTVAQGPSKLLDIRGEAGIGKTRVLEELVRWCRAQGFNAAYTKSYAAEGALAYAPIADWLRSESIRAALDQLEPIWQSELARVLPELLVDHPDLPRPAPMTESWQRKSLFEAIARAVRSAAPPLLLVLDDAQWADGETLEWVHYFLREESPSRILVAAGIRSDDERSSRPLAALLLDLLQHDQLIEVELPALSEAETALLASQLLGSEVGEDVVARIFDETEGHPLYVMEIARGGLASLDRPPDPDPSVSRLPPRILATITSRLEQLSEGATEALEVAATIGRAFTFEALEQASELEEAALVRALDELWQRQIVREQGLNTYDFGHDRIRDAAYSRIGPRRRRLLHRRVAQALELLSARNLDTVSAQIAAHYEAAGLAARAIEWFERAAEVATRVSANVEAVRHLTRAVGLIGQLPPSLERDRDELRLQIALASPTVASRGYATGDFALALDRARILAATVHDARGEILALNGLTAAQIVHGEIRRSLETARASVELVGDHPELVTACEMSYGGALTTLGMQDDAVEHFERAVRAYLPGRSTMAIGFEPGAFAMSWESHALWLSGAPDRALDRHRQAMELAVSRGPHSLALANAYGAVLFHCLGDDVEMAARARAAIELCERYGFAYYGEWGQILLAWHDRNDPGSNSVSRIEAALSRLRSIGAELRRPHYLAILAQTHHAAGDDDRANAILGAAVASANANEDRYWLPEIHRLIADFGPGSSREATLRMALDLARSHGSRSLTLRIAISLVRHAPDAIEALRDALEALPEGERSAETTEARDILDRRAIV
jgi:DNA-binding SARP family transcriptional activator